MSGQRLLLDSHTLYWALDDPPKLSRRVHELVASDATDVFASTLSLYELMFKANRRRLATALMRIADATRAAGFRPLPPNERNWKEAAVRDWAHGDPFDRLLLAQAEGGGMALLSKDEVFDDVSDVRVW